MAAGGARIATRVRVHYEEHLSALSLQEGENVHTILAKTFLPTVQLRVILNNLHLYILFWEYCERQNLHVSTSPNVMAAITGMLKTDLRY